MSAPRRPGIGKISWVDLTVVAAPSVRDFHRAVAGWEPTEVEMGGYADYCMIAPGSGEAVAGVCHARGMNADLPPQWLVYIAAENLAESIARCLERGGAVIAGPRDLGSEGRFCVIRDPAGAVAALVEPSA